MMCFHAECKKVQMLKRVVFEEISPFTFLQLKMKVLSMNCITGLPI